MAYYRIEPFGGHAEEMRFGILGSILVSLLGGKSTEGKLDPRNFTLSLKPKVKTTPMKGLAEAFKSIFKNAIPSSEWSRKNKRRKEKPKEGK
jgi:hypothetical protein